MTSGVPWAGYQLLRRQSPLRGLFSQYLCLDDLLKKVLRFPTVIKTQVPSLVLGNFVPKLLLKPVPNKSLPGGCIGNKTSRTEGKPGRLPAKQGS